MLRLLKSCPFFAVGKCGKQFDFTLEPGTLVRPLATASKFGSYPVEVYAGKYEGIKGNIPSSFYAADIMVLAYS